MIASKFDNVLRLVGMISLLASPALFFFISSYLELKNELSNTLITVQSHRKLVGPIEKHHRQSRRNVFIDLGTNDGSSTKFFLGLTQRTARGDADLGGNTSSPLYGLGKDGNWEIYVFEGNKKYDKTLADLRSEVMSKNLAKSFTVYNHTAIGTVDGYAYFYFDNPNPDHTTVASSLNPESSIVRGNPRERVVSMDIATLLRDVIGLRVSDNVVLKIDVEGTEYDLMRRLFASSVLRLVDTLAVEYHHDNPYVLGNKGTREKYTEQYKCITWMLADTRIKLANWA
eukprot:CAMPEP_0182420860 /NCGR_PEP_ID=MMETSP1167-20130531/5942_1 /TAXON_ID=2988 /ORGANISM="Mallomonas Sp, Strain CCMP3275" /LENGTH=284 /DNA_ID=CAMNT_0024597365 /DNA_START=79 /DNA_END=933 /DNA_ORIENTATION=-